MALQVIGKAEEDREDATIGSGVIKLSGIVNAGTGSGGNAQTGLPSTESDAGAAKASEPAPAATESVDSKTAAATTDSKPPPSPNPKASGKGTVRGNLGGALAAAAGKGETVHFKAAIEQHSAVIGYLSGEMLVDAR